MIDPHQRTDLTSSLCLLVAKVISAWLVGSPGLGVAKSFVVNSNSSALSVAMTSFEVRKSLTTTSDRSSRGQFLRDFLASRYLLDLLSAPV